MKKNLLKGLLLSALMVLGASSAKALDYDTDGKAIIATAQDLVDYANWWNSNPAEGKIQGVDAYLTADIDMAGVEFPGIGHDGHENNRFHATLDGQGHRIKNLHMEGNEIALIRVASDNVVIKNLILDSSCSFTGTGRNAAFISASNWPEWGSGKIEFYNCGNEAEVIGTGANCAAYVGCNYNGNLGIVVKNCYNTGHIKGDRESAAVSGWLGGSDKNSVSYFWNIAEVEGVDGDNYLTRGNLRQSGHLYNTKSTGNGATQFDEAWVASGELCWTLNQGQAEMEWFQTLGTDAQPTPLAGVSQPVYKNGDFTCGGESKGSFTFGNTNQSTYDDHTIGDNDICTVCGQGAEPAAVNGVYQIASIGNMLWLANQVNNLGHTSLAAVLTADLVQGDLPYQPIGNGANPYKGSFDGQGHSVTLNIDSNDNYQGIFGVITDGVHIQNLTAKGTITGGSFVGGIAGGTNGGTNGAQKTWLQNCGNEANVTAHGNNAGGMIGVNMGSAATFLFQNCYNTGNIAGGESGALSGWIGDSGSSVQNCWSIGAVNDGNGDLCRNNGSQFINCYAIAGINGVTTISAEAVASGELCWNLNQGQEEMQWFQTLGTDATPTLKAGESQPVYKNGAYTCAGEEKGGDYTYGNTDESVYDEHACENGLCTACGQGVLPVEGTYYIQNVESGSFLSNGAYWGTRSVLFGAGVTYDVVLTDGKYTLKSGIKNANTALRPSDGFNDQSGAWELISTEGGVYMFNGTKYFCNAENGIPQYVDQPTEGCLWKFVTAEDRKAMLSEATAENPVDATVFITAPDFHNSDVDNAAWGGNGAKVGGDGGSGSTLLNSHNTERWNDGTWEVSQKLVGLPAGLYKLTAQAFYRHGGANTASIDAYINGTDVRPVMFAGDKTVDVKSIYSEAPAEATAGWQSKVTATDGTTLFIPNGQNTAAACLSTGAYVNELEGIVVGEDGELTIGLKREGDKMEDWTVFDSFRLTYYGEAPEEAPFTIAAVNGEVVTTLADDTELAEATALNVASTKTYGTVTVSVSKMTWNEPNPEWGETEGYYSEEDVYVESVEKNEDGTWTALFGKQPQNFAEGFKYQIKVRGFEGEMFDEEWNLMPYDEMIVTIQGVGEQDAIELTMDFAEVEVSGMNDDWQIVAADYNGVTVSYPNNNVEEALGEKAANAVLVVNEAYLCETDEEMNFDLENPLATATGVESTNFSSITLFADVTLEPAKNYVVFIPSRGISLIDKAAENEDDALLWTNMGMWDEIRSYFTTAEVAPDLMAGTYLIQNLRTGKYAVWKGDDTQIGQDAKRSLSAVWNVIEEGDHFKLGNHETDKLYAGKDLFTEEGTPVYILKSEFNEGYFVISETADASGNCWDDQGNKTTVGYWHPSANDNQGTSWKMIPVDTDELLLSLEMENLLAEATEAYEANTAYIKGDGLITSVDQLSSPYTESSEGSLAALIDGDANSFWHSAWSTGAPGHGVHYLDIALPENTLGEIEFSFTRRNTANNHLTQVELIGINGEETTSIAVLDLPYGKSDETLTPHFVLEQSFETLRLLEQKTTGNDGFWHAAEIQLYPVELDSECLNAQAAEAAAAMEAAIEAGKAVAEAPTQGDIDALKAALEAYLKSMEAVGVNSIDLANANAVIYNIAGQRVSKAQKGVYVINGKKVLVK